MVGGCTQVKRVVLITGVLCLVLTFFPPLILLFLHHASQTGSSDNRRSMFCPGPDHKVVFELEEIVIKVPRPRVREFVNPFFQ